MQKYANAVVLLLVSLGQGLDLQSAPQIGADLPTSAAQIGASQTPATLLRGLTPWSQDRVNELVTNGSIQASWLPDIRAVRPDKLMIQNEQQRSMLRFSNSIANTGASNLQVRRGVPITNLQNANDFISVAQSLDIDLQELALASQELLDSSGQIVVSIPDATLSAYHPEHKHFHIGETAGFTLERQNSVGGWDPVPRPRVVKTTFCLIDIDNIVPVGDGDPQHFEVIKSPVVMTNYHDCNNDAQGITSNWMDRYHHSVEGQEINVEDLANGIYRLVVRVNTSSWFLESDYSNNEAWQAFELKRDSKGNQKIRVIEDLHDGIWFSQNSNGWG